MEYVEQRNGGYYVAGTRVSLDSVVYGYLRDETPEQIAWSFKALTLEQVNRTIEYYLLNRDSVDEYLKVQEAEYERLYEESRQQDPDFYARMDVARREIAARRR
jgi:uncharacterized protein (DUF433 family)